MKIPVSDNSSSVVFPFMGQHLHLLPEKVIFWEEQQCLLLSDLHLGKAGHFRKAGIGIPAAIHRHDLQRLENIINRTKARRVLFLGDLFHSEQNNEWWTLEQWLQNFPEVEFTLIKGNHDILPPAVYQQSGLQLVEEELELSPFILTHEPLGSKNMKGDLYNICGHIHPAVQLHGGAFQRITLPCFYFGLHYGLLPAFGKFTGFYQIKPKKKEYVFAIAEHQVLQL